MAQVAISARAATSRAPVALEGGPVAGELEAEGGRLGMDAWLPADGQRYGHAPVRAFADRGDDGVDIL